MKRCVLGIFLAIAGNRSQKLITFEDLIFLLYDLIQSFRSAQEPCLLNSQHSIPTTTTANFAFAMMKPNEEVGYFSYVSAFYAKQKENEALITTYHFRKCKTPIWCQRVADRKRMTTVSNNRILTLKMFYIISLRHTWMV